MLSGCTMFYVVGAKCTREENSHLKVVHVLLTPQLRIHDVRYASHMREANPKC